MDCKRFAVIVNENSKLSHALLCYVLCGVVGCDWCLRMCVFCLFSRSMECSAKTGKGITDACEALAATIIADAKRCEAEMPQQPAGIAIDVVSRS